MSIKHIFSALGKRFSPEEGSSSAEPVSASRRGFFAKAAIGAVSVSGTAGLAKVVVDSVPEPDTTELYRKDGLAGEQELLERDYVLMSDQEKEDMVQQFVDDYHGKS